MKYFTDMDDQKNKGFDKIIEEILQLADQYDQGQPISQQQYDDIKEKLKVFPKKTAKDIEKQFEIRNPSHHDHSEDEAMEARSPKPLRDVIIDILKIGLGAAAATYGNRVGEAAFSTTGNALNAVVARINGGITPHLSNLAAGNVREFHAETRDGSLSAQVVAGNLNAQVVAKPGEGAAPVTRNTLSAAVNDAINMFNGETSPTENSTTAKSPGNKPAQHE